MGVMRNKLMWHDRNKNPVNCEFLAFRDTWTLNLLIRFLVMGFLKGAMTKMLKEWSKQRSFTHASLMEENKILSA